MKLIIKTSIIIIVLILGSMIIVPNIYNVKFNDYIEKTQKSFEEKGMELKIKTLNDDYFNIKREYILQIKDSSYLFLKLKGLVEKQEVEKLVNNTELLIEISLPKYPTEKDDAISISFKNLSSYLEQTLLKEKIGQDLLSFIKNRDLELVLSVNNFEIKKARLKDIDLRLLNKNISISETIKNFVIYIENFDKFDINIEKISSSILIDKQSFDLDINSSNYKLNREKELKVSEELNIKHIRTLFKERNEKVQFSIEDLKSNSTIDTKNSFLTPHSNMQIADINMDILNSNIKLKNFNLIGSIEGMKEVAFHELLDSIKTNDEEKIYTSVNKIINDGLIYKLDKLDISNIKLTTINDFFELNKINSKLKVEIKPNIFNLTTENFGELVNSISANYFLKLPKNDIMQINNKFKIPAALSQYINFDKDQASIDLKYDSNSLYINDKRIQ
ncbi:hypothetical protein CRV08_10995 [Halarcobacter ebronensis]|uniref:DUF945 domain-containing protein n=1 Tax=Halarcobacter ebronensis TaxID=1462615 RepID=A0A4Q0YDX9_9BACT|nr:hypothetical protein [Halarcobacter ebronensis]RXJ67111.1 hypothetical protein CRV08_10995 [Halarcobacter ebronensis]